MTKTAVNRDDFDYGQYAPEVQHELQKAAEKIRTAGRDEAEVIIKIGDALSQVKKKVRHGNWGAWLDLEFTMSVSSASRYIRAAAFGRNSSP